MIFFRKIASFVLWSSLALSFAVIGALHGLAHLSLNWSKEVATDSFSTTKNECWFIDVNGYLCSKIE